jgi:hypothetical protein
MVTTLAADYRGDAQIVRVPEVLAYYRWHPNGQISSVKWRQVLDAWQVRRDFAQRNPELIAHFDAQTRRELLDGVLLKAGYVAYWKRDLVSAHRLFRERPPRGMALKDARYLFRASCRSRRTSAGRNRRRLKQGDEVPRPAALQPMISVALCTHNHPIASQGTAKHPAVIWSQPASCDHRQRVDDGIRTRNQSFDIWPGRQRRRPLQRAQPGNP